MKSQENNKSHIKWPMELTNKQDHPQIPKMIKYINENKIKNIYKGNN